MGLEDTVAKYTVEIQQNGTLKPAVEEFNQLRMAAQNTAGATATASTGLREVREASMVAREGMRGLNEAAILLGGSAFPELTRTVMLTRDAMMVTRGAALLTGASLAAISSTILAMAAAVIPTAVAGWQAYKAHLEEVDSQQRLFAQTQDIIAKNFDVINKAQSKGLISQADYDHIEKLLMIGTDHSLESAMQRLGNLGLSNNAVAGYEKLQALENKMHMSTMDHFDQEKAKAWEVYNSRLDEIRKLASAGGISGVEGSKAERGAATEYNSTISGINSAQQERNAADLTKQIDDDLFLYQRNLSNQRQMSVAEEVAFRIAKFHEAEQQGTVSEDAFTNYFLQQLRVQAAAEQEAARQRIQSQKEVFSFEVQLYQETLKGSKAQNEFGAQMKYAMNVAQIQEFFSQGKIGLMEMIDLTAQAGQGFQNMTQKVDEAGIHVMTIRDLSISAAESFASGFAHAFVEFASGQESAGKAFGQFAAQFLQQAAEMIIQLLILKAILATGLFAGTGGVFASAPAAALGGLFPRMMADGGTAGMLHSPTYFPQFNVVAGEAGAEMMAVLARPTFRNIGGIDAVVGSAGPNRLALTDAGDLEKHAGAGGHVVIEVRGTPDFEARVISNSVKGARVQVAQDMKRHSPISAAVKNLTA